MIRRTLTLLLALTVTAGLTGCSLRSERGTLIGAGVGLVAGALLDHEEPARGAIVGATIGAIGGYAVASEHDYHYGSRGHGSHGQRSHRGGDHGYRNHGDPYDDCSW